MRRWLAVIGALGAAAGVPLVTVDSVPPVALVGLPAALRLGLHYGENAPRLPSPCSLYVAISQDGRGVQNTTFSCYQAGELAGALSLPGITMRASGTQTLTFRLHIVDQDDIPSEALATLWCIPGWLSLLPPAVVVLITAFTRHVLAALFLGVVAALTIINRGNLGTALLRALDTYVVDALANPDHVKVLLFTWLLGAMVAVVHKSGGGLGLAAALTRRITTRRGVQLAALALGVAIFFDDYANALIMGASLREAFDHFLISREKFCFLVDCTAAPIASIAPLSSWIGFELSLLQEQIDTLVALGHGPDLQRAGVTSAYALFLHTIPSRFYSLCMLAFVGANVLSGRDFGPMLTAERRAVNEGRVAPPGTEGDAGGLNPRLEPDADIPRRWWNAAIPIGLAIGVVLGGLVATGWAACLESGTQVTVTGVLGSGDAMGSIVWGGAAGLTAAVVACRLQCRATLEGGWPRWVIRSLRGATAAAPPILGVPESAAAAIEGVKGLTEAVMTLVMAWAIGRAVQDVGCAQYIAAALTAGVAPAALPALTFVAAALIALCTGTSWGTMAILFPAVVPAAWIAAQDFKLWSLVISAILAGSVCGDHASTVSDTTIISAMACRCDLRRHVVTQGAYSVVLAAIALVVGYVGSGFLWPVWVGLLGSITLAVAAALLLGVRVDDPGKRPDPLARLWGRLRRRTTPHQRDFSPLRAAETVEGAQLNLMGESEEAGPPEPVSGGLL